MGFSLRSVYDAVEKRVTPVVEDVVHSDEFRTANQVVGGLRRAAGRKVGGVVASALHLANLPAGTDVKKLRRQIGELDYEVRQLRMELAERDAQRKDEK
ncbi:hypothetical protein [Gordonia phthalatica]|uniref:Uncharacterized protein n=1 Tax=Gordonia phthalatica TaxID=1136941 RepID=A0A0N9N3Y4_9ACTN|nr:hypothetical protein [Gordonia phthalatica]ALG85509.1 hypothetical protein ACH46_14820 [Gordonia phthalatica]